MDDSDAAAQFGAIDPALLGMFFISYAVFALIQINTLCSARYLRFAALTLASLLLAQGLAAFDFSAFCADRVSVIICGGGRGLRALAMVWVFVSLAMLGQFALVAGLRRLLRL